MEIIELNSWDELHESFRFPSDVERIEESLSTGGPCEFYFRGQANAEWELTTTLQRIEDQISYDLDFSLYLKKAISTCGAVDSYTDSNWDLDNGDISNLQNGDILGNLLGGRASKTSYKTSKKVLEYLIFLRHCGFPSPLLDWSESPYVAAFFAFAGATGNKRVAIYRYQEMPRGIKHVEDDNQPKIHIVPYDFATHKRHYLQQTRYTLCVKNYGETQGFGKYEEAILASEQLNCYDSGHHQQDSLIKYTIPSSERNKVLRQLDKMNITHISLFDTEDALIQTLALRVLELWKD